LQRAASIVSASGTASAVPDSLLAVIPCLNEREYIGDLLTALPSDAAELNAL
jgi:hypothetical protein